MRQQALVKLGTRGDRHRTSFYVVVPTCQIAYGDVGNPMMLQVSPRADFLFQLLSLFRQAAQGLNERHVDCLDEDCAWYCRYQSPMRLVGFVLTKALTLFTARRSKNSKRRHMKPVADLA